MVSSLILSVAVGLVVIEAQAAWANVGTITANGPTVTAVVSSPNVAADFTFSGTAGEVVTVTASAGTFPGSCDFEIHILDPAGSPITSAQCAGSSAFLSETTLSAAGTYTVDVFPTNGDTGQVTLSLSRR